MENLKDLLEGLCKAALGQAALAFPLATGLDLNDLQLLTTDLAVLRDLHWPPIQSLSAKREKLGLTAVS